MTSQKLTDSQIKQKISEKYNIPVSNKYFIVGRELTKKEVEKLGLPWKKAGPGEIWIEIPKKLIDEKKS